MEKDFNYLVSTFKSSIKTWDYFVNWNKVFTSSADIEIVLNKLNICSARIICMRNFVSYTNLIAI